MNEKDIFDRLFSIFNQSNDQDGAVAACLVRDGQIICETVSNNEGVHAEYALLKKLEQEGKIINPEDIVYTTVEPCGKRTPGGRGEKMGDCTSNLIKAGVKSVVFAASDPHASDDTRHKFGENNAELVQIKDKEIRNKAADLFNSTCKDRAKWLPLE